MSEAILLVEDEKDQRLIIESILTQNDYHVASVATAEEALAHLNQTKFDLILSDWKLPGMNGEQLLNEVLKAEQDIGFILITAHSDPSHAIKLMRAGADDYLPKPFDQQSLLFTVKKLLYLRKLKADNHELEKQNSHRQRLVEMIGQSEAMNRLFTRIIKAAPSNANLLISGESGTGKELAARAIYQLSNRKGQVFLPVNCAAIPENLAEAELFGAEKGSFTGASQRRIGKLEASHQGTIFLDEIGELPLLLQSKLLRFLQEGTISRIGSNKEIKLDVRVIAATNRDLEQEVKLGNFREDLYYRLNVIPVKIPPLRQRKEDIPLLINQFLDEFSHANNKDKITIDKRALKLLIEYPWPGNVRQLRNAIERLVLLSSSNKICKEDVLDLDLLLQNNASLFQLPQQGLNWEEHEKDCLLQALEYTNNNKSQAAKLLNLSYKAFLYRLEKFSL